MIDVKTAALVSIHDVEPRRLARVLEIVSLLESSGVPPVTLLVVPGLEWAPADLEDLRALVAGGHELAGHGWEHQAPVRRTWYHRVHAALLSRNEAEHLSRSREDLVRRLSRCRAWFGTVGLPTPDLYVPPAWAMGRLGGEELAQLGFSWYETLSGFVRPSEELRVRLPLVGFEADTRARRLGLELWNAVNLAVGTRWGRPVRLAIHPDDLHLRLAGSLSALLLRGIDFLRTGEWLSSVGEASAAPAGAP